MGWGTALTLGALAGTALLGRRRRDDPFAGFQPAPASIPQAQTPMPQPTTPTVEAPAPPTPALQAESQHIAQARRLAARTRRRAQAGSAGRVTTGTPSAAQRAIRPVLQPATLLGY